MAYRISKQFHFSAVHFIQSLPQSHPCGRREGHGHNYIVEVVLETQQLEDRGFVVDHGDLSPSNSGLTRSWTIAA